MKKINVNWFEVSLRNIDKERYISLTDIARFKSHEAPADVVKNWMITWATVDFFGLWEGLNNPEVNMVESDQFKQHASSNVFTMSSKKDRDYKI